MLWSFTHSKEVSNYQDEGIPDLRFADRDAEAFANFLRSPAGGSLDQDHLKVLINEKATAAQFAIMLVWLWEVAAENDRVLNDVVSTLSIQNKSRVLLIADTCRSGKLSGSELGGVQATAYNLAKQYNNEIKILSCQPDEYSIEGEQWGGGRGDFAIGHWTYRSRFRNSRAGTGGQRYLEVLWATGVLWPAASSSRCPHPIPYGYHRRQTINVSGHCGFPGQAPSI